MNCARCRDAISARLDGEGSPAEVPLIEAHVAACGSCRRFADDAARITRLARTAVAVEAPDVTAAVLAAAPRSRRPALIAALRVLLGLVGLAQLAVAVRGLLAVRASGAEHAGAYLNGASLHHFAHESAAWNLALGVGFCWVAWRSTRTSGMVPTLAAFVLVLTGLEVLDLLTERVELSRLLMHCLVQLGLVLVILLDRWRPPAGGTVPGGTSSGREPGELARQADPGTGLDVPGPPPDLRPTALHRHGAVAAHGGAGDPGEFRRRSA